MDWELDLGFLTSPFNHLPDIGVSHGATSFGDEDVLGITGFFLFYRLCECTEVRDGISSMLMPSLKVTSLMFKQMEKTLDFLIFYRKPYST